MLPIILIAGAIFAVLAVIGFAMASLARGEGIPGGTRPMMMMPTIRVLVAVTLMAVRALYGTTAPIVDEARYEVKQVIADSVADGNALYRDEVIRYRILVQRTDGALYIYEADQDELTMTTLPGGEPAELIVQEADSCASLVTCILLWPGSSERYELRVSEEDIEYNLQPLPGN